MDPFSAAFLTTLAGKLAGNVAASLTGPLKRQVAGTPAQQAVERSLRVALVALAAQATAAAPEQETLLRDIFDKFFHYPAVWVQIGRLLKDRPLDRDELGEWFAEAGYDAATLPNLDFDAALDAFEVAFVEVADGEKELQGIIQIGQLRRQTGVQVELLSEVRELVAFLKQSALPPGVGGGELRGPAGHPIYVFSGDLRGAILNAGSEVAGSTQSTGNTGDRAEAEALRPYLETVVRRSGRLPLGPLNPGGHDTSQLGLLKVFVNLDAAVTLLISQEGVMRSYRSVIAHAHKRKRLIFLGDPGSGKSTIFRYLALCLASHYLHPKGEWLSNLTWTETQVELPADADTEAYASDLEHYVPPHEGQKRREIMVWDFQEQGQHPRSAPEEILHSWTQEALSIPVLVELRNFAQTDFNPESPVALWEYVSKQLKEGDLDEAIPALKRAAQRDRVLFLFDGVDEVPPSKRRDVWRAIASIADGPYGGCRWIAACRVLSFVPGEAPLDTVVKTLAPLSEEQIHAFIDNWYRALTDAGESFASGSAGRLKAAAGRSRLRSIAQNPMLLTIMALVQTYYGSLPDERARLYQQCVETLLLRWQRHKEQGDHEMPSLLVELGISQQELERLLWEIAWQAHSQGFRPEITDAPDNDEQAADIPESEVMAIACRALGGWGRAEQFIHYTERRAHLLLGRGGVSGRLFTFPHRTFQEYLAACYLASDRRPGKRAAELACQGDYWREVLNLAAGTLVFNQNNREKALDAIDQMLPKTTPAADDVGGWRCVWLAGEMAETVGREAAERDEIGRDLLPRVCDQLAALVSNGHLTPVQRAAAGVALGRLGDPRPDVACDVPACVEIPAGRFWMGSERRKGPPDRDELAYENESTKSGERFKRYLPAYKIGKYPVTVAQFRRFVEYRDKEGRRGYEIERYWTPAGWARRKQEGWIEPRWWDDPTWSVPNHPVVGVSWYEAVAYCAWLSETTGRRFRLPDEAMWEKAARGTDRHLWPWGNEWDAAKLNAEETIGRTSTVGIFPAGSRKVNDLGDRIYDCAGNVLEWCSGPGYPTGQPHIKQKGLCASSQGS